MSIKPVLVPDHTANDLRKLMDHFAEAAAGPVNQQLNEMDYGGGRSPHAGMGLPRDDDDGDPTGRKEIMVKPEPAKKTVKSIGDRLDQAFAQAYNDKGVAEDLEKKFKIYYAYIDYAENDYEKTLPAEYDLEEEIVVADSVQEAIRKFKHQNPDALVDSAEPINQGVTESEGMSRAAKGYEKYGREGMAALARAGREGRDLDKIRDRYNRYDETAEADVTEGRAGIDDTDTVGFSVNSEAAYNAVMARFGNYVDHDETSGIMSAPARLWPEIEMTAFDADPDSGAVRTEDDVMEAAKPEINFTPDDIKELEGIRDLATLKTRAMQLIARPSQKPMKPEKIQWFRSRIDDLKNPMAVIKLMYDLLLSGEGNRVIGTRSSMGSNTYRQRFGEDAATESAHTEPAAELSESSDPVVCLKADIRRLLS